MIIQFFAYAFGILAALILLNLVIFFISKKLALSLVKDIKEITWVWLSFFKNGIPVPADHKRIEVNFMGQPILTQAIFREQGVVLPISSLKT